MTDPPNDLASEIMAHLNDPFMEFEISAWYIAIATAMDIKVDRIPGLRCHEVARAAARIFYCMEVQDGHVGARSRNFVGIEHSWLWTKPDFPGLAKPMRIVAWGGNILDPWVQGGYPPAQLVSGNLAVGEIGIRYRPGLPRTDIREDVVDAIEARFREVMARGSRS